MEVRGEARGRFAPATWTLISTPYMETPAGGGTAGECMRTYVRTYAVTSQSSARPGRTQSSHPSPPPPLPLSLPLTCQLLPCWVAAREGRERRVGVVLRVAEAAQDAVAGTVGAHGREGQPSAGDDLQGAPNQPMIYIIWVISWHAGCKWTAPWGAAERPADLAWRSSACSGTHYLLHGLCMK